VVTKRPSRRAAPVDWETVFDLAPVGMVVSRERAIVACNRQFVAIFGRTREAYLGQSFALLYPTLDHFERTGRLIELHLDASGRYADERIMRRDPARGRAELFWCHVTGRALDPAHPHEAGIWTFEEMPSATTAEPPDGVQMTPRERDVAVLVAEGRTSKQIADALGISFRTVDVHRASLLRKFGVSTTDALIDKLTSTTS
jgi:PAS domain S-box-containing protein